MKHNGCLSVFHSVFTVLRRDEPHAQIRKQIAIKLVLFLNMQIRLTRKTTSAAAQTRVSSKVTMKNEQNVIVVGH